MVLGGCLEEEKTEESFGDFPGPEANAVPLISGIPASTVQIGNMYSFTPNASDADNDTLTFSIQNRPDWASFDSVSGQLSGQPTLGDVGDYNDIRISVSDGQASASLGAFEISVVDDSTPPPNNSAPVISGNPATVAAIDTLYSFTPGASDADGDDLTFSIQNRPAWATFNTGTGQLSGQPTTGDIGVYSNILISVSDGQANASLAPFAITVQGAQTYSITLNWSPPTENDDGSPLTDLAGFRLYWGTTPGMYTDSVTLTNPGLSTYVVENLTAGTYGFVTTAFNSSGEESAYSNLATKTVP